MEFDINGKTVELSDDQVEAFHALTRLQQGMVVETLRGLKPSDAHRAAGGKCKNEDNRTRIAGEILRNPSVDSFLQSFKQERAVKLAEVVMSRDEMAQRLTAIARTRVDDLLILNNKEYIDEDGEVVQQGGWAFKEVEDMTGAGPAAISELTAGKKGLTVKLHDQVSAMKQLADLMGWNKQQVELSGGLNNTNINITAEDVKVFKKAFNDEF